MDAKDLQKAIQALLPHGFQCSNAEFDRGIFRMEVTHAGWLKFIAARRPVTAEAMADQIALLAPKLEG